MRVAVELYWRGPKRALALRKGEEELTGVSCGLR